MKLHGLRKRYGLRGIHFIDTNTTKVNSENCIKLFNRGLLRDCKRLYPDNDFIFRQDGQHPIPFVELGNI